MYREAMGMFLLRFRVLFVGNLLLVTSLEVSSHFQSLFFPGGHFRKLSPLSIYESSIPLTYVLPHNLFELPTKLSPPTPSCTFTSRHLRQLAAVSADMDHSLGDLLSRSTPVAPSRSNRNKTKRALTTIGNFLSWCCSCATETELHMVTENEDVVNKHINAVQEVLKDDHLDLVRSVDEVRGFSKNVTLFMANMETVLMYV